MSAKRGTNQSQKNCIKSNVPAWSPTSKPKTISDLRNRGTENHDFSNSQENANIKSVATLADNGIAINSMKYDENLKNNEVGQFIFII